MNSSFFLHMLLIFPFPCHIPDTTDLLINKQNAGKNEQNAGQKVVLIAYDHDFITLEIYVPC